MKFCLKSLGSYVRNCLPKAAVIMKSSNGNIFRVAGLHRWIPRSKASDAEHRCFFICALMNGWVNNREAGDLRRHRAHYDVTVMMTDRLNKSMRWNVSRFSCGKVGKGGRHQQRYRYQSLKTREELTFKRANTSYKNQGTLKHHDGPHKTICISKYDIIPPIQNDRLLHGASLQISGCRWDCESVQQSGGVQHPMGPWKETHHNTVVYMPRNASPLQWRHNEHDDVSKHQHNDCLLNRLFRHSSKKTSKLRVAGLCDGNSPVTGEFPIQRACNTEIFPFDDIIMQKLRDRQATNVYHILNRLVSSLYSYTHKLLIIW